MKKMFIILGLVLVLASTSIAMAADETSTPVQEIKNTKGFTGVNYDRQDSKQTGIQKIVNDHSAFNINIQIIKEGALFGKSSDNLTVETEK